MQNEHNFWEIRIFVQGTYLPKEYELDYEKLDDANSFSEIFGWIWNALILHFGNVPIINFKGHGELIILSEEEPTQGMIIKTLVEKLNKVDYETYINKVLYYKPEKTDPYYPFEIKLEQHIVEYPKDYRIAA